MGESEIEREIQGSAFKLMPESTRQCGLRCSTPGPRTRWCRSIRTGATNAYRDTPRKPGAAWATQRKCDGTNLNAEACRWVVAPPEELVTDNQELQAAEGLDIAHVLSALPAGVAPLNHLIFLGAGIRAAR